MSKPISPISWVLPEQSNGESGNSNESKKESNLGPKTPGFEAESRINQSDSAAESNNQKNTFDSASYAHRVQMMSQDISVAARARRERLASEILVQLAAGTHFMVGSDGRLDITPNPEGTAFVAVYLADALIARLDAPPQEGK